MCVKQGGRLAACTSTSSLVAVCPYLSGLPFRLPWCTHARLRTRVCGDLDACFGDTFLLCRRSRLRSRYHDPVFVTSPAFWHHNGLLPHDVPKGGPQRGPSMKKMVDAHVNALMISKFASMGWSLACNNMSNASHQGCSSWL